MTFAPPQSNLHQELPSENPDYHSDAAVPQQGGRRRSLMLLVPSAGSWRRARFFSAGSPAQHPQLDLEGGRRRHLSGGAEAGLHCPELPGSGALHHAGQPFLHEVLHQGSRRLSVCAGWISRQAD